VIYDLNKLDNEDVSKVNYDVCVIGAGAAGITIANKLSQSGLRIALCEAGGKDYTEESQNNYLGKVIGDPYFKLDVARLRFLGGTTNHWNGWCRPFEKIDFERNYLGDEFVWPISLKEIDKYQFEACDILEIDNDFNFKDQEFQDIRKIKFQFSPPVRFKDKYIKQLSNSQNINLILNANFKDINGEESLIKEAIFESYNKKDISIKANKFVFAMGGIENSRYLLWLVEKYNSKFFNSNTPIGKYWMEHPHFTLGSAIVKKSVMKNNYYSLNDNLQKSSRILNCGFRVNEFSSSSTKDMVKEILCIAPKLGHELAALAKKNLICGARLFAAWEQEPNISNAVILSNNLNGFGIPQVKLNWKKSSFDKKTIKESVKLLNEWLLENDLGRLHLFDWLIKDADYPSNDELGGYHHMGGTRMSASSKYGVVNKNCRVYGSKNLFIAGSSIFTTGGHNNPTLPIVQFSLRLAEHLIKTKNIV